MHVLQFCFIATGVVYSFLYDNRLIAIFIFWLGLYEILTKLLYPSGSLSVRKKLQLALWSPPSEGNIFGCFETDLTNVFKYLKSENARQSKITLTHICIKMLAMGLASAKESLNGKIVFGKFVPFPTVDISCLVDVDGGKDLAVVLVKEADKLNFDQIAQYIQQRASSIKKKEDTEHQTRTQPLKLLPTYVVSIVIEVVSFIAYGLGISIPQMAIKKDQWGAGLVTSIGSLGFKDVFAPFTPSMRSTILLALNQVEDKPIVKDGQIVIAPVVKLNFTIDHRFLDGGRAKFILKEMQKVMDQPELYA